MYASKFRHVLILAAGLVLPAPAFASEAESQGVDPPLEAHQPAEKPAKEARDRGEFATVEAAEDPRKIKEMLRNRAGLRFNVGL